MLKSQKWHFRYCFISYVAIQNYENYYETVSSALKLAKLGLVAVSVLLMRKLSFIVGNKSLIV